MSPSRSVYTRLVSAVLFPLHERLKHHHSAAILRRLEATQWWSAERLEAHRLERLQRFLGRVGATVPYYRRLIAEAGLDHRASVRDLGDLRRLPLTDKTTVRAHFAELRAEGARHLAERRTTGSTGEPLRFLVGPDRVGFDVAAKWRATRWWGVDIGDPEVVVWGSPIEVARQDRLRRVRDGLLRSHLLPIDQLSPTVLDRHLAAIRRIRPRVLFGYPSALAQLARRAAAVGLDMKTGARARVAFVTSETLQPAWREIIVDVFGCAVATEYGARDVGYIARECPEGGLHVTAEYLIVEILDPRGQPVPVGERGEVVVTNLESGAFPFIRYRTGDMAALSGAACSCGRGLPLLQEVAGRANECLVTPSGVLVHPTAFNSAVRAVDGVHAYKVVQESLRETTVLIVAGPGFDDRAEARICARYRELLGPGVTVRLERVDDIPREASGKFRHVVTRVRSH
jgi:phenylacetate-coenzyme A ligase PaaK-like adenylate-forming protein